MAKNYTYPRVAISSTAKLHSSVQPPVADTTVMFLPVSTEKGPAKEIVRIHSLPEFIGKFGNSKLISLDIKYPTVFGLTNLNFIVSKPNT